MTLTPKHIGIWLRVSTEDQVKGESLEVHAARAKAYADSRGWEIKEIYRLEAVSGKSVIGHREAKRMLADIKSGHISGLIFSKLARLSRNNRELLDFAAIFQEHNADLISLAENIDTSTPAGRMFFSMIASMATWEREEIVARVRASVPIRAKLGRPLGGQAQYGYAWQDKQFVLVEAEAVVRRLMYELFLDIRRLRTVARIMNERGYRTRTGKLWAGSSIERLLRDPTAKGQKRYNYTESLGEGKAWIHKPEETWVYHPCPRIVSDELWESVNSILTEKKLTGVRVSRGAKTLFGGLCLCHCGSKMYIPSNMHQYVCTACKHKIPSDTLDAIFESEVQGFAFKSETLHENYGRITKALADTRDLLTTSTETQNKVESQIDSLLALHHAKAIDEAGFTKRYTPLRERSQELTTEITKLKDALTKLQRQASLQSDAQAETVNIAERYTNLSFTEKRRLVEAVIEEVVIGDGEVRFTYLFDPQ
jgi:site-specific DNA recombinase